MTKTLLEMSELRTVPCTDQIEIAPMVEEIFADLSPLADRNGIALEFCGNGVMTGSDTLIYRLIFNLTENAIRYNRPNGTVNVKTSKEGTHLVIRISDTGHGIPEQYRESIFQPFSVWTNPAAANTAVWDLVCRLFGKLPPCTAVMFGLKKVRMPAQQ